MNLIRTVYSWVAKSRVLHVETLTENKTLIKLYNHSISTHSYYLLSYGNETLEYNYFWSILQPYLLINCCFIFRVNISPVRICFRKLEQFLLCLIKFTMIAKNIKAVWKQTWKPYQMQTLNPLPNADLKTLTKCRLENPYEMHTWNPLPNADFICTFNRSKTWSADVWLISLKVLLQCPGVKEISATLFIRHFIIKMSFCSLKVGKYCF